MEESSTIPLTFSFEAGVRQDPYERFLFWNLPTTQEWFKKRGYTLYDWIEDCASKPALPSGAYCETRYPYAHYDDEIRWEMENDRVPLLAEEITGKVVYAQDSSNRHVVIKVVHANTDEDRVLKFLSEQRLETLEENCILPVLELLANGNYWFAVMPRWGDDVRWPNVTRLCEAIDMMHCMLKGLVFLHKNNIYHGDIKFNNVVVNHFCDMRQTKSSNKRKELRLDRRLSYALIDFDFSVMLPSSDSRLPYDRSWGTFNLTGDTGAGEFDYDPFAFDVGAMGVKFCNEYQGLTGLFPALAPLLDMMTTWNVRRRFTSTQALEFFEAHVLRLSQDELQADISAHICLQGNYNEYDRWQDLPPDLVEGWKLYRETPQPWTRRLLRAICDKRYWCHIVPWTRWLCFQVFSQIPRRFYLWLAL